MKFPYEKVVAILTKQDPQQIENLKRFFRGHSIAEQEQLLAHPGWTASQFFTLVEYKFSGGTNISSLVEKPNKSEADLKILSVALEIPLQKKRILDTLLEIRPYSTGRLVEKASVAKQLWPLIEQYISGDYPSHYQLLSRLYSPEKTTAPYALTNYVLERLSNGVSSNALSSFTDPYQRKVPPLDYQAAHWFLGESLPASHPLRSTPEYSLIEPQDYANWQAALQRHSSDTVVVDLENEPCLFTID